MMTITKSSFVTSLSELKPFPGQGLPEIALAGKSNVGKSSLINSLTNRSKLARTSSEPGKTRLVNFYLLNEAMFLVDLPGYGFAKAPKQEREKWAAMIEGYLSGSRPVSYTHLDVYKRQLLASVGLEKQIRGEALDIPQIVRLADALLKIL